MCGTRDGRACGRRIRLSSILTTTSIITPIISIVTPIFFTSATALPCRGVGAPSLGTVQRARNGAIGGLNSTDPCLPMTQLHHRHVCNSHAFACHPIGSLWKRHDIQSLINLWNGVEVWDEGNGPSNHSESDSLFTVQPNKRFSLSIRLDMVQQHLKHNSLCAVLPMEQNPSTYTNLEILVVLMSSLSSKHPLSLSSHQ